MVANLLEAHQKREHDAAARDAVSTLTRRVQLGGQFLHGLLIERRLRAGQVAVRLDLGLVRQVGDHGLVCLQTPENVRSHQLAQRRVRIVRSIRETPGEARELFGGAEQAGVDEVEDGPEVPEPILDRRAGQRDPRVRVKLLGGPRLPCARILDGLRFVQYRQMPRNLHQPRDPQQRSVARDHEIHIRQSLVIERLQLDGRHRRWMRDERPQARREACDLRRPVRKKRRRRDEQARPPSSLMLPAAHQYQRQHLHRLAQAHVVGQARAEAETGQEMEPAHAHLLVGPQGRLEIVARLDPRERVVPLREQQVAARRQHRAERGGASRHHAAGFSSEIAWSPSWRVSCRVSLLVEELQRHEAVRSRAAGSQRGCEQ